MRKSSKAEANKVKLTRTKKKKRREEHEQTRKTMVTQKDVTDKIVLRLHCLLSPPPPHSEAASDSPQPRSTSGSTPSALHRSDHVSSNVSTDTAHLGRTQRKIAQRKVSCGGREKTKLQILFVHLVMEWNQAPRTKDEVDRKEWTIRIFV